MDIQDEFGPREFLFSEGNAPLYRDISEPFDFKSVTTEAVTGKRFIPKFDPEYAKVKLAIQREELVRRLESQKKAPQGESYRADTEELRRNAKKSLADLKKIELAIQRQKKIEALRLEYPGLNRLASNIESEAFKEFALARESDTIQNIAILQDRSLTEEEMARVREIEAQEGNITKRQSKIVSSLASWDAKLKELGLDPKKWGGSKMGRLLAEPVSQYADVKDIATLAGVGPFRHMDSKGDSYLDSEVQDIGGMTVTKESLEGIAKMAAENDARWEKNREYNLSEAKLRETVKARPDLVFQLNSALFK
jgi:hypothetical protein